MTVDHQAPPERLRKLVAAYRRSEIPAQAPIPWPLQPWLRWLQEHQAFLSGLPPRLDRAEVRRRSEAPQDAREALAGLLVTMVWGFGGVGYGPWRVRQALDGLPELPEVLLEAARQAASDAVAGYRTLAFRRPPRIGPAFATKYLHFAVPCTAASPLILDRLTAGWINQHGRVRLNAGRWSPRTYQDYLGCVGGWAAELEVAPAVVEELIFRDAARSGQWSSAAGPLVALLP